MLKFAVIIAKKDDQWVLCKHYADIEELETELHSEIEKVYLLDELPEKWTYPLIQPRLLVEATRRGYL